MRHIPMAMVLALAAAALPAAAPAQPYPNKPVRLVVAQPAGGPTDAVGRLIGQMLAEGLGQNVIIDNRVGAGGTLGTAQVAKSKPDGYTLLVTSPGIMTIAPFLFATPGYDSLADFTHVSLLTKVATVLVVPPSLPVKSVGDLIKLAKSKPGQINMASGGNGTVSHLTGELFKAMAGVNVLHVPYKGSSLAATEVMGGQVDMFFLILNEGIGHVRSGRLKGLATTGTKRSRQLADVPTVAESGVPGFVSETWFGLSAPAGLPDEIVVRLRESASQGLQKAAWRERLDGVGLDLVGSTPQEYVNHIKVEMQKWGKVIKQSGATVN